MKTIFMSAISILLFTSCTREISSDVYASRQVGEVSMTYPGIVRNIRQVYIQSDQSLENNGIGLAGGGLTGGMIGNSLGRGRGIPTVAGAIAGAVTGSLIEQKLKQQRAFEYTIELYNGSLMTVVQGQDYLFSIGQPVYIIVSQTGRSRITPQ